MSPLTPNFGPIRSVKHFFEPSAGVWKLTVLDQGPKEVGSITSASLILRGVPIIDADRDGLDDHWERSSFGSLAYEPQADPDGDGFNNAREQILQTPPTIPNRPFAIDLSLEPTNFADQLARPTGKSFPNPKTIHHPQRTPNHR